MKNVGFSAEHGGFFRERKSNEWTNLTKSLDMGWMLEVEEIFLVSIILRYVLLLSLPFTLIVVVRNVDFLLEDDG